MLDFFGELEGGRAWERGKMGVGSSCVSLGCGSGSKKLIIEEPLAPLLLTTGTKGYSLVPVVNSNRY